MNKHIKNISFKLNNQIKYSFRIWNYFWISLLGHCCAWWYHKSLTLGVAAPPVRGWRFLGGWAGVQDFVRSWGLEARNSVRCSAIYLMDFAGAAPFRCPFLGPFQHFSGVIPRNNFSSFFGFDPWRTARSWASASIWVYLVCTSKFAITISYYQTPDLINRRHSGLNPRSCLCFWNLQSSLLWC